MQPQLFVTPDFDHMLNVLESFADTMHFRTGGTDAVEAIIASQEVGTVELDSGIQISGKVTKLISDPRGNPAYIETSQTTALAYEDEHLDGLDQTALPEGWSSPIGPLKDIPKPLHEFDAGNLLTAGIIPDHEVTLEYQSGIQLRGKVKRILRREGKILVITFQDCLLLSADDQLLFSPEEGDYHLAVGNEVASAYSGTADKEAFNVFPEPSTTPSNHNGGSLNSPHQDILKKIQMIEESNSEKLQHLFLRALDETPNHWLIFIEILKSAQNFGEDIFTNDINTQLSKLSRLNNDIQDHINSDPITKT
jgi:phenylalanine-4-hydroxylase